MIAGKRFLWVLRVLPALAVLITDVYLLLSGEARASTGKGRLLIYLGTVLIAAIGLMTGSLWLQLACFVLMLGLIVLGAASIGLFFTPALGASLILIIVESYVKTPASL